MAAIVRSAAATAFGSRVSAAPPGCGRSAAARSRTAVRIRFFMGPPGEFGAAEHTPRRAPARLRCPGPSGGRAHMAKNPTPGPGGEPPRDATLEALLHEDRRFEPPEEFRRKAVVSRPEIWDEAARDPL